MRLKIFLVSLGACVVLAGTVAWLLTGTLSKHPGTEVSVTLLGYTNNPTGIPRFGYAGSNVMHSSFAVFNAHNPTRSHFACFLNGIYLRYAGSGQGEVIPLQGALASAQQNRTALTGLGDFQLPPGATLAFAVPVPEAHGTWQCLLNLVHVRHYKHAWQFEAVVFAQRLGLHFGEQGQTVFSREVVQ